MNALMKAFTSVHAKLIRATKGRAFTKMGGNTLILLTTRGNKSGKERTVPLMSFDYEGDVVVIASAGGSAEHPSWYRNLAKNPAVFVERDGKRYAANAEVASGELRSRIWKRVVAEQPRFAGYEKSATTREIPVVVLKAAKS